jgi:hypothetical protein
MQYRGLIRLGSALLIAAGALAAGASAPAGAAPAGVARTHPTVDGVPVYSGAIKHVMVIELENESESSLFGSGDANYIDDSLEPLGTLVNNYYAVGHVSLDNYIAEVSGQAPNQLTSSDCITPAGFAISGTYQGVFQDLTPGTLDPDQTDYPGQYDGQGCVMPSGVETIGNQLDALPATGTGVDWREYAEDMGNDPTRDGGDADLLGGTDCAHPVQSGGTAVDDTEVAEGPWAGGSQVLSTTSDQYTDRHNPFIYFHSVIDDQSYCDTHVVPLGTLTRTVTKKGKVKDAYVGHLVQDLSSTATTPAFSFVTPNLCNDGHDSTCAGTNSDGTTTGGLTAANDWLSNWMPMILKSPAYRDGSMLVVITSDEGGDTDFSTGDNEQPGPNSANPGYSPLLNTPEAALGGDTVYQLFGITGLTPNTEPAEGTMPGGGQIGALLLNRKWVRAGNVDTSSITYNHYSALRTYEDLLGITTGGADDAGHLGFASTATPFGTDVFTSAPIKG